MKIIGASALNANDYKKISMHKNVNILGSSIKGRIKASEDFTKSLKNKTEAEKQEEVIRYFLRNHKITMVYEDVEDFYIKSESGIELSISKSNKLSNEILREIIQKYNIDRMEEYVDEDVSFYWFMNRSSKYCNERGYLTGTVDSFQRDINGLPEEFDDKRCMVFDIGMGYNTENGEYISYRVSPSEKVFLDRMLEDMSDISFYGYSNDLFRHNAIFKCKIDDKERFLVVPRELAGFANKIDEKMKKKEDSMKLQYKMEGF
jgi:hypothetical protein